MWEKQQKSERINSRDGENRNSIGRKEWAEKFGNSEFVAKAFV